MMQDQEFRERFDEWARPLQGSVPPPVSALRARARRRLARRGAAGAAGLAVIGVIGVLIAGGLPGRPGLIRPAAPASVTPPGRPYLVTIAEQHSVIVRNEATGRVTGTVTVPARGYDLTWVAAEPSDREFVLVGQPGDSTAIRFYVLRLSAAGRPAPLRPVSGPRHLSGQVQELTVGPDGAVAVAVQPPPGTTGPAGLWAFRLGAPRAVWHWTGGPDSGPATWSGTALAFGWQDPAGGHRSGLRAVSLTGAPGGPARSLLGSSRLIVGGQVASESGQLSPDGSRVVGVGDTRGDVVVTEFSAATGRRLWSVPLAPEAARNQAGYCGVLWASASGRAVLAQCGHVQAWIHDGRLTRVHLPTLVAASPVGWANTFAW